MRHHAFSPRLALSCLTPALLAGLLTACGGDRGAAGGSDTAAATGAPATPAPPADTGAAAGGQPADTAAAPAAPSGPAAAGAAAAARTRSRSRWETASSTARWEAPPATPATDRTARARRWARTLNDKEWLHSDGSLPAIVKTIKAGVPKPTKAPAPMPPMGGAALSDDQVNAVAAYVYSLGHGGGS